jgi:protoheme IX farnesyltransferase
MAEHRTLETSLRPFSDGMSEGVSATTTSIAALARDTAALAKPRITALALIVAAGSMLLAPGHVPLADALWSLFGIGAAVAGAGALNMLVERDVDALMDRTADRPLPARRMSALWALFVGASLSGIAQFALVRHASALTVALTAFSLFVYVLVYTPMKRTSPWALVVGAVPGAMPALMGSSSISATFDKPGVALFAFVLLWQIPHFLAIALYREREYVAAGMKVAPAVWGRRSARIALVASAAMLALCGVALSFMHVGGKITLVVAIASGAWFVALCVRARARRVFRGSLVYITVLFGALAIDTLVARL